MVSSDSFSRTWDEKKVVAWLHSIKCGQYESIFRGMELRIYRFIPLATDGS